MALPTVFDAGAGIIRRYIRTSLSANGTVTLPKGCIVDKIFTRNKTAAAVTGGIKIGTTSGGTDIVAAHPVTAGVGICNETDITVGVSANADQTLYIQAVTSWNSASIDVLIVYTEVNVS